MPPSILVTKHVYPEAIELLKRNLEVDYNDARQGMAPRELLGRLEGREGVVCQLTDKIDATVLDACPNLKVVANVAVGYDNIDVAAATERGVVVTNTPGVLTETTADLAFALILAAGRRVTESERYLRDGKWGEWYIDLLTGFDVHGATLGLLGMGRIGQAVARRARGFDMRVLYHNRSRLPESEEQALGAEYVSFDELLAQSDYVSVHVPLGAETRHIVDAAALSKMQRTAILINTARGPVVDEEALAGALAEGVIAYAGLDVFEKEPEVHAKLLEIPNVVLAPHIGSASVATRTRMCTMAAQNCIAALTGERPPNALNPEVLGS